MSILDLSQTHQFQATKRRQLNSINVSWAVSAKECGGEGKGAQGTAALRGTFRQTATARQKELMWEIRLLSQLFLGLVVCEVVNTTCRCAKGSLCCHGSPMKPTIAGFSSSAPPVLPITMVPSVFFCLAFFRYVFVPDAFTDGSTQQRLSNQEWR